MLENESVAKFCLGHRKRTGKTVHKSVTNVSGCSIQTVNCSVIIRSLNARSGSNNTVALTL
jgi:hypothetical protein